MRLINALLASAIVSCVPFVAAEAKSTKRVVASFYKSGKVTANGEKFNPQGLTAAHKTLPFGTKVKVTNLKTKKSVVVRINDRGPFIRGRTIDLAYGAAQQVGMIHSGIAPVSIAVMN